MNGQTETGRQRLAEAVERAHEAVQEAHARLYDVELSAERCENDLLSRGDLVAGIEAGVGENYADMRTQLSELRPLLVPIVRWLQSARKGAGTHGS